ncbi:MAG: 4-carboxymuconolactone decarboxylase [SAR86 cluster bacterium]|uniref:4-carboxymuconolactone decarboxylase n=1 Tax=SAR86 cluster bacterium TaxID=2030880 RepID=A0A2A5C8R6_9GAMM|nr:MAG: 4-carboxymuconolactone decarboxylase [SAR86 cluster bacterium]
MSEDSREALRQAGLKIRREVLGAEHVDKSIGNANDFNRPMQDLLHEYCWGYAWNGKGLTKRERSILNLGMLTALGRSHEVAVHTRGARNNGLTNEEISEIFVHTAIYCGVPAAVDSFREATKVLEDYDK